MYSFLINCNVLITTNVRRIEVRSLFVFNCTGLSSRVFNHYFPSPVFLLPFTRKYILTFVYNRNYCFDQGYNARKVISEVCASFVLQCTVSGRYCKHKTDVEAWHGIHLSHKKSMKYSGHRKLLRDFQNYQNLILNEHWCIYSCLQIPPKENWFQYVRRVYTTAIKSPCIITLVLIKPVQG